MSDQNPTPALVQKQDPSQKAPAPLDWIAAARAAADRQNQEIRADDARRCRKQLADSRQWRALKAKSLAAALEQIMPGVTFKSIKGPVTSKDGYLFQLVKDEVYRTSGEHHYEIRIGKPILKLHKADPDRTPVAYSAYYDPIPKIVWSSNHSSLVGVHYALGEIDRRIAEYQKRIDDAQREREYPANRAPEVVDPPPVTLSADAVATIQHLEWMIAQLKAGHHLYGRDRLIEAFVLYFQEAE